MTVRIYFIYFLCSLSYCTFFDMSVAPPSLSFFCVDVCFIFISKDNKELIKKSHNILISSLYECENHFMTSLF